MTRSAGAARGGKEGGRNWELSCCVFLHAGIELPRFSACKVDMLPTIPLGSLPGQVVVPAIYCSNLDRLPSWYWFAEVCPYEAYCPEGQSGRPYGGPRDEGDGLPLFAPLLSPGVWVDVSASNPCGLLTHPKLGDERQQARHVMCCKPAARAAAGHVAAAAVVQQEANEEDRARGDPSPSEKLVEVFHRPRWFDRADGWVGDSHPEAEAFCSSRGLFTCPYDAYCPDGAEGRPFGGARDDPVDAGSWAPTSYASGWVRVSSGDGKACDLLSSTEFGNEKQTRHILCCEY